MDVGSTIALTLIIAITIAIALYYIIKKLLTPKLHVKSDKPNSLVSGPDISGVRSRKLRSDYLRSSFSWINSESSTANSMSSIMQDLKFQLSAFQSYDCLMCNLVQEHKDRVVGNDPKDTDLMEIMLTLISELCFSYDRVQYKLNSILEANKLKKEDMSKVASEEDVQFVVYNYQLLNTLGQRIQNSIYSVFNIESERSLIIPHTMNVQTIMTECDRKLIGFDQMKMQNQKNQGMKR
ncbi:hypothetical protein K6025_04865 [Ehrlichia sp. JZT12]